MGKKNKQLSQAEIWDDSALLNSWDEALAEYKRYHSIHARGERVEDVIETTVDGVQDEATSEDPSSQAAVLSQSKVATSEDLEDGELEEEPEDSTTFRPGDLNGRTHESEVFQSKQIQHPSDNLEGSTEEGQQGKAALPNAIISGVKDEALKHLMMSWYYAGYYTGLYEGQQQGHNT